MATAREKLALLVGPARPADVGAARFDVTRAAADLEVLRGGTAATRARAQAVARRNVLLARQRLARQLAPPSGADVSAAELEVKRAVAELAALQKPAPPPSPEMLTAGSGVKSQIVPAMDAIRALLRRQHNLPPAYADDFSTEDQAAFVKEAQQATTTFRVLTFALGGIALLVGGIGIMNMMLVSVRERTREIGIRKSVGADPRTVQAQFLIEAVVLSTLGGLAGILVGLLSTRLISAFAGLHTLVDPAVLPVAFGVALAVGLFFGYYPARRAARLDPITALRYE